jgi:hypothetical protein
VDEELDEAVGDDGGGEGRRRRDRMLLDACLGLENRLLWRKENGVGDAIGDAIERKGREGWGRGSGKDLLR